jgi:hypothetical protein
MATLCSGRTTAAAMKRGRLASQGVHQAHHERPLAAIGTARRSTFGFDSAVDSLQRMVVVRFFSDLLAKIQPDLSEVRAPAELLSNQHRSDVAFGLGVERAQECPGIFSDA